MRHVRVSRYPTTDSWQWEATCNVSESQPADLSAFAIEIKGALNKGVPDKRPPLGGSVRANKASRQLK